ncbi:hypothetical protein ACLX1H_004781 [Fusarium chlamydosporum]
MHKTYLRVPKMAMTDEEIMEEIRLEARMIQRVYDYFQSNIKAGELGVPNSRSIKAYHLKLARTLEPVYKLEECSDDKYEFGESWIKEPGALKQTLSDFYQYAGQIIHSPGQRLVSLYEQVYGREAAEKYVRRWYASRPMTIDWPSVNAALKKWVEREEPVEVTKPFVEYQKFEAEAPYEPTKEELAEIERRHKESKACGTPSEQTARCFLFDLIDTDPSARAALEKQARDDPKAAFHLALLRERKAVAEKVNNRETLSGSGDWETSPVVSGGSSGERADQEEAIRQMYAREVRDNDAV